MAYLGKSVEKVMHFGAKPELFNFAQEMRKNPTETEQVLWKTLRKFRFEGFVFRRQHPIDIFVADFYCHKLKLVIEVDGEIHFNQLSQEYDFGRTGELEKHGMIFSGASPDDKFIEMIELPDHPFGLAVQWHPEWLTDQQSTRNLFRRFVEAAGR